MSEKDTIWSVTDMGGVRDVGETRSEGDLPVTVPEVVMFCCAALIFVFGVCREVWFRIPGTKRPAEPGFAPTARRPMPGGSTDGALPTHAPVRARGRSTLNMGMLAFALGVLIYAGLVAALLRTGAAEPTARFEEVWLARDLCLALVAICAAVLARRRPARGGPSPGNRWPAGVVGVGCAWWPLGLVDMHLLTLFEFADGSLRSDLLFHGSGAALMLVGSLGLVRTSSRSHPPTTFLEITHVR